MSEEKYIKSPLNYTGGKYKILGSILPLFPKNIHTFVDLFAGGFNVGINVDADMVVCNDIEPHICELYEYLRDTSVEELLIEIHDLIYRFKLSKTNQDGYNALRDYYNEVNNSPIVFYTLLCYAFNYQIRFNKDGKYNMPFGKNRSSFNKALEQKFINFVKALHSKNVIISNKNFYDYAVSSFSINDFVYCDPPYLNSTATYNEKNGWTEKEERKLLSVLDILNCAGVKFALSNNLKYQNGILADWIKNYNVHYIDTDYSNCNYHKKDKDKDIEILVTNY